jgi:hypothetical protein
VGTRDDPERLLAAALKARGVGEQAQAGEPGALRLPVLRVLLFAVILGVLAGGIAGVLSLG